MATPIPLLDAAVRHQVFVQRYAAGQSKAAIAGLRRMRREVLGRLAMEPTEFQAGRLAKLLADIDNIILSMGYKIGEKAIDGAVKLAVAESEFTAKMMGGSASVDLAAPSSQALIQAVERTPMGIRANAQAIDVLTAFDEFAKAKSAKAVQMLRDGIAMGDTNQQISAKIGTMLNTEAKRQLNTLVRTAVNHASSVSREMTYEANADILEGYRWVSTLDNRTTLVCASRDGQVYQLGQGPLPPAHFGCRSTTIPVVREQFTLAKGKLGDRAAIGAEGVDIVGPRTTYGSWLKTQPKEFVDEALGPERSKLFRSGELSIEQFVDPTGRAYTLDELQAMTNITLR